MPLYEEKFISPFAIRFSQWRIRPTFQDERIVEESMDEIEAVACPKGLGESYEALLKAPFPPIEIIRWRPKLREEDGTKLLDEDGSTILGEACWFTFDNRRLYCLQAAAVKKWPLRVAAIVHVLHDLPLQKCAPRKFQTTDLGCSVSICRRYDTEPPAVWNWSKATSALLGRARPEAAVLFALASIAKDAGKEEWSELLDVPQNLEELIAATRTGAARTKQTGTSAGARMASAAAAAAAASAKPRPRASPAPPGPCSAPSLSQSSKDWFAKSQRPVASPTEPLERSSPQLGFIMSNCRAPVPLGLSDLLPGFEGWDTTTSLLPTPSKLASSTKPVGLGVFAPEEEPSEDENCNQQ